jgi:hypothetical protein
MLRIGRSAMLDSGDLRCGKIDDSNLHRHESTPALVAYSFDRNDRRNDLRKCLRDDLPADLRERPASLADIALRSG